MALQRKAGEPYSGGGDDCWPRPAALEGAPLRVLHGLVGAIHTRSIQIDPRGIPGAIGFIWRFRGEPGGISGSPSHAKSVILDVH
jgi:hypothetical protein